MNIEQFLMRINNNSNKRDFGVKMNDNGLLFYLKNDNTDNVMKNPYKEAIELATNKSVYQVYIIDYLDHRAYTYTRNYYNGNGEEVSFQEFSFDWFAKNCWNLASRRNVDIYFETLVLESTDLLKISKIDSLKKVIGYIKCISNHNIPDKAVKDIQAKQLEVQYPDVDSDLPF
ncbi:hypothetical protein [Evansella cellulosilytica]|nr:hypothetical protein [Evansella cellulosilytica]